MKKYLLLTVVAIMLATPVVSSALTKEFLWLFEKDPSTWDVIDDGAWGYMDYRPEYKTFAFWFGALGLEPDTDYTLIYYPDPWPGAGLICLGSKSSNSVGKLSMSGSTDTAGDLSDAKIWLVLSDDVDCGAQQMIGWNPDDYLFEYDLINFLDTDD